MSESSPPAPRVVLTASAGTRGSTARAVAAETGGEIVRGWTEGLHVLRRRATAQRAHAVVDEARQVRDLVDRLDLVDADLAQARAADAAGAPTVADELRALAEAAQRSAVHAEKAAARLASLNELAEARPPVTAPADVVRQVGRTVTEAELAAREVTARVGTRPPYEERIHQAATKADWREREALKVERWSAHIGRGAAIAAAGLGLMIMGSGRADINTAAFVAAAVAALALVAWIAARIQLRQESHRLRDLFFKAGVESIDDLERLEAEFRDWEQRNESVEAADATLGRALAAWEKVAPGCEPEEADALAEAAHQHDYAAAALPAAQRAAEVAGRRSDVTRGRWFAETARLGVLGSPADVETIVATLAERSAAVDLPLLTAEQARLADELRRILHGRRVDRLLAEADQVATGFAPHELEASSRPVVIDVDEPLPSRRQQKDALDEVALRGQHVETVLVTSDPAAAEWGFAVERREDAPVS